MRWGGWLIGITLGICLCWLFPLFHVVSLEQAQREEAEAAFDPDAFAKRFWNERLMPSFDRAVDVKKLLGAIEVDAREAREQYGRSVGLSESYMYYLAGEGRVVEVGDDEILLDVTGDAATAEVSLQVGFLFGNTVRDGTGLLDVNDYPNSQDFNAISEAVNHLVEERVLTQLRDQAKVGNTVHFVGCAEVSDDSTDLKPLKVVPIQAIVE